VLHYNFGKRTLGKCPLVSPESKCQNKNGLGETACYVDELTVVTTKVSHFLKKL
jgi:hypothetical protein